MWETACDRKKAVKKLRRQFVILDVLLHPYVWRTVRRLFSHSFSLFPGYAGVWYFPVFVLRVFAAAYIWPLYLTLACICYFMDDYKAGCLDRKEVFRMLALLLVCIVGLCSVEAVFSKMILVT